jgi:glycosyltransferase involved in cell wall biosynthesis
MRIVSSPCTVVMATFNGSKYLSEQLCSLEDQVLRPCRLIVSDDGSSDGTREILTSFSKKANFDVVVVDGPRQGYAENFWSAAKLADTKYLAWADQDDVWCPQKILRCVQALEETSAFFVSHTASVVDDQLRPLGRFRPYYRRTRVLGPLQGDPFEVPSGFASIFRREILNEVDWGLRPRSHQHDHLLPHDHAVGLIAFAFHSRVQLSEALAYYRQHGSNVAGDPSVVGLARVSTALKLPLDNYERLAAYADRYGDYLSMISESGGLAADFFHDAATRARLRQRLRGGEALPVRLSSLVRSAQKGNYRAKDYGGFGFPAFLHDALALCLSRSRS